MSITNLFTDTAHKKAKRVGRGIAAGQGKTAGRGTKGQKSRSGSNRKIPAWFEGGQTPLFRKLAKKRGFSTYGTKKPKVLTTTLINQFYAEGEIVSVETLLAKKLIRPSEVRRGVKVILGAPLKANIKLEAILHSKKLGS